MTPTYLMLSNSTYVLFYGDTYTITQDFDMFTLSYFMVVTPIYLTIPNSTYLLLR